MKLRGFAAALAAGAGVLGAFATGAAAQDDNVFRLAFVAFLSGPAAESFGKPAVQGAKTVIDALNAGSLPKPYDKIGFGGLKIEVQLIDEAGGAPSKSRNCATPSSATMSMQCWAMSAPAIALRCRRRPRSSRSFWSCSTAARRASSRRTN